MLRDIKRNPVRASLAVNKRFLTPFLTPPSVRGGFAISLRNLIILTQSAPLQRKTTVEEPKNDATLIAPPPPPGPEETMAPLPRSAVEDIELPACFYLGREYDLAAKTVLKKPIMYDARDLTTHGVVVGMTGSGKTGLCISLLEEAALDGIPCIIIDPKGDLTNLLLQFPDLDPKDFLQWINPEEARQKGVPLEEYARQAAEKWRKGLAEWDQDPQRIARLRSSSEWRIYTPGSDAGLPLSVLQTFAAPKGATTREALNQKIDATTTALLGLTGISADPVQSREHILIAQLLLHSWSEGKDLDLPQLIAQVQAPPMSKIGAFDVDTFYPEKDRLKLAVALNNILAAPSFSTWITGEALDLARMLYAGDKPRQLIFYVAHLEDAQRMFFLTLLFEEVLSWTRKQPGTTSLRAILYFDEVFGYLPPHPANPPTKIPLMTLLKQARAFGVGILLATQNPVDLDYKALSNAGTWFIGKLQTERDKARLVEGLEGVAAERGSLNDRGYLETVISALSNRVFLLHDVHRGTPILFQSRQALSYLRGPLTREHVALLMDPVKKELEQKREKGPSLSSPATGPAPMAIVLCPKCAGPLKPGAAACPACGATISRAADRGQDRDFKQELRRTSVPAPVVPSAEAAPALPPDLAQFFLPRDGTLGRSEPVVYQAAVLGFAEVVFRDRRRSLEFRRPYHLVAQPPAPGQAVAWASARWAGESPGAAAEPGARWTAVPETLNSSRKLKALEKAFADFLYGNARLTLLENVKLGLVGNPGEDVLAFQERCRADASGEADKALRSERLKYQPKFGALGADLPVPEEQEKGGFSLLSWLNPLNLLPGSSTRAPAQNPPRGPRQQEALRKLEVEWHGKQAAIIEKWKQIGEEHAEIQMTPRRADVQITHFGLAWVPH
jgi:hypothetical protein